MRRQLGGAAMRLQARGVLSEQTARGVCESTVLRLGN
jgi:hypothetical protein